MKHNYSKSLSFVFFFLFILGINQINAQINFSQSNLDFNGNGNALVTTSLKFGPDGRLYFAEYSGTIKALTIERNGPSDYKVINTEVITGISGIQNHNDDGSPDSSTLRQTTGITVAGTSANPIIYATSSDFRIGGGVNGGSGDTGLDTNSGVITRFSWNGSTWDVVDIVRGLPRSEENHATNGLEFVTVSGIDYLIVAQGGHTNGGSPSINFNYAMEYALSGAILSINLDMLEALPIQNDNGRNYIYDIPTLDDPTRPNANGITDPNTPGYNGIDVNDPFGGNDGLNQAMIVPNGPVQIFSPGYRNAYDLVITESGAVYVTDNGANGGWGGFPENEGTALVTNNYVPGEPGSSSPSGGEQINNEDHLQLITTDIQNYVFGSYYGGHPNPIRANPNGAGLYTTPNATSNAGAVFRTLIYDPDGSTPGSTTDASIGLPANWPPVPSANPVEGDWRGPGIANPDGPVDDIVTIWGTNTNGIDEYTATNFGGAMQGDLLAGTNFSQLRRVELNPDGSLETLTPVFASNLGGNALGVSCNGDSDPFPGTIWIGIYTGSGGNGNTISKIVVLEPADLVNCIAPGEPGYDANADYDNDGYTNQDEEQNGSDPCNGGSQPNDFDKNAGAPYISDLNDLDDDNDGILDAQDPFQLGDPITGGSDAFAIPVINELFSDTSLGGYLGLGMTGLMNNGDANPNWLNWIDRKDDPNDPNPNDILGGAIGAMTMNMTAGTALGATNTQEKGFQYGVQVEQTSAIFTVASSLANFNDPLQLYGNTASPNGELGIFMGDGTQSNYIKIVITKNGISAQQEINDVPQPSLDVVVPVQDRPNGVVFYFVVNPANGEVVCEYTLVGVAPRTTLGTITAAGNLLTALQQASTDLAVGLIGTSNATGVELQGTWDFLNVLDSNPFIVNSIPNLDRMINSSDEVLTLDNFFNDDGGTANLTYTVQGNTNTNIGAVINANELTLSYPGATAVSDITIRATDGDTNFVEQTFTVTVTDAPIVLYRVNTGGPEIAAIDGGIVWEQDTPANNSANLTVAGSNQAFAFTVNSGPSVPATTPATIFNTERADNVAGAPNMTYSFPVGQPGNYEVRLYMGNGWSGTSAAGQRLFDVQMEGITYPALNDIDLSGTYGHQVGALISHVVTVNDGAIDISFIHGSIENPMINGIEILDASDTETPIYVNPIADQKTSTGEQLIGNLAVSAYGGDGNKQYSAQGLPPGLVIEPTNGQIGGIVANGAEVNSPYNVTITVDDSDGLTNDAVSISFEWVIFDATSYRVNVGGNDVTATDDGVDWKFNNTNGAYASSMYSVNTGFSINSSLPYSKRHSSLPAYIDNTTFNGIFGRERYDAAGGAEMEFKFPLENGDYMVNLYLGNSYELANQVGDRIFDISLEGVIVKDDLDLIAEFGHNVAGMLSFPVTLSDGELNILFLHGIAENPIISAIEIFEVDTANPTLTLTAISAQSNDINEVVNFTASASGGDPGEGIVYYISGQPEGISINSNSGQITGTIDPTASAGGPNSNGVHQVVVTAVKPGSAPSSKVFSWTIASTWINKNEDETYTARHENSFVQAGNKFYLMGGRESAQTIDVYDYTSNSWTSLVNSAPFEFNHFQATEYQGLIWVIGSFKDNAFPVETPAEYVWAFDPANEEWIQGPQIPTNRRRGSAGLVLHNNKFYVVAGNTQGHNGGYVPYFDEYDPATG
ncbi:MAG: malectin domain-containing carbohydrate-binding protein, partial [Arenibacter troitsensis]|nr:malectin domain-containing carbohydrate-binding protein [Arenibacter troitsensis]